MITIIQTVGAVGLGVVLIAVVVLGLVSSLRSRRGSRNDPNGDNDYPTHEGPTPGYWGEPGGAADSS